jgi:hypothetical protein
MTYLSLVLAAVILAGCSGNPPPAPGPSTGSDSPLNPPSEVSYKPVMAGTAFHAIGSAP